MRVGSRKRNIKSVWDDERFTQSLFSAVRTLEKSPIAQYITHVYLYGSCARGDYRFSSDIDLFLVLDESAKKDTVNKELTRLRGDISPTDINSVQIDLHATIGDTWENDGSLYHKNIRKDGIDLWQKEPIGTTQKTIETT